MQEEESKKGKKKGEKRKRCKEHTFSVSFFTASEIESEGYTPSMVSAHAPASTTPADGQWELPSPLSCRDAGAGASSEEREGPRGKAAPPDSVQVVRPVLPCVRGTKKLPCVCVRVCMFKTEDDDRLDRAAEGRPRAHKGSFS